jgi:membrane-bound serine protease (ClpP class)
VFVVGMGLKAQRLKPVTGNNALIGMKGNALTLIDPSGMVKVNGETWKAISISGKVNEGEKIIVKEIKDLTLYVEAV